MKQRSEGPGVLSLVIAPLLVLGLAAFNGCAGTPPLPGDPIETNPAAQVRIPPLPELTLDELVADACGTRAMLRALGAKPWEHDAQRYREICGD